MAAPLLVVDGMADLQRALAIANRDVGSDVKAALESAADPVRFDAQKLALSEISGMARSRVPWHSMRVGVTRSLVYVAPVQRGVKSRTDRRRRRPNLFDRLLGDAMEPALERNITRVERELNDALGDLVRRWERV